MGGKQDKEKSKYREAGSSPKNAFKLKSRHYSRNNSPLGEINSKSPKVGKNSSIVLYNDSMEKFAANQKMQEKGQLHRYPELFENEKDSDVTFLVGIEPAIWRLPAHKFILVAANPVFAAMLKGPLSSGEMKEEVPIEDLDPKAFENVLRYIYTNGLKLTSIDLALATVFAAEKYMILDLIQLCLQHLEVNLTTNNVLEIYPRIRFLALSRQNPCPTNVFLQTPNVHIAAPQEQSSPSSNNNLYTPLLNRCLEFIDQFADQVLCLEDLEGLSEAELSEIVFRDSLQLKSELRAFRALETWATQQCKFQQREITVENKRKVLESVLYSVRYVLMSRDEFMSGPYLSDLLSKDEKTWFLKRIDGHHKCEPPQHLTDRQRYFQKKRCNETAFNNAKGGLIYEQDNLSHMNYPKKTSRKRCCRVTKVFTEVFLCFSLFFD